MNIGSASATQSPDLDTRVKEELIAQYKATINNSPNSPQAVEAVRAYYSLVRTDRQDKLSERSQAAGYLQGLVTAHASLPLGHSALQLLIIEKNRTGDLPGAIALSHQALTELPEKEQSGVLFNLVWLTLSAGEVTQAQQLAAEFRARFPELASEAAHLEETLAEMAPDLAILGSSRVVAGKTALPASPGTAAARQAPPEEIVLTNYPNPFNPETRIRYALPQPATVRLAIYNLKGQEVRRFLFGEQAPGEHTVVWAGRDSAGRQVGSGVYVYKLSVQPASGRRFKQSRKLVLVR